MTVNLGLPTEFMDNYIMSLSECMSQLQKGSGDITHISHKKHFTHNNATVTIYEAHCVDLHEV